jgi:hypothetical protein
MTQDFVRGIEAFARQAQVPLEESAWKRAPSATWMSEAGPEKSISAGEMEPLPKRRWNIVNLAIYSSAPWSGRAR